jgi:hypothetical protein
MNRKQTLALWAGVVVFILMGICPPYNLGARFWGYKLIFVPLRYDRLTLAFGQLVIQWIMVVVATATRIYTWRDNR